MKARLTFGSVCSGIEAATVAWHGLGWRAAWLAEIDKFASAVLAHHYPSAPNLGDMTKIARAILTGEVPAPDVLCGGTPCQAFSVAGLRQSLDDARGNLTLKFVEIANAIDHVRTGRGEDECIVFWENVPGVLSTKDNAFGCFLGGLAGEDGPLEPPGGKWANAGAVYGPKRAVAWRLFDAQFFALAQRRRRVFVVACPRDGADPVEVLFEREGVQRHSAPSREAGQGTAGTLESRSRSDGFPGTDGACAGHVVPTCFTGQITNALKAEGADGSKDGTGRGNPIVCFGGNNTAGPIDVATARNAHSSPQGRLDFESETFCVTAFKANAGYEFPGRDDDGRTAPCLQAENQHAVAFRDTSDCLTAAYGTNWNGNSGADNGSLFAANAMQVRRLTPRECERLQGFPDDYTLIPWKGKPAEVCPDGPRYKALGNSMAVPCMRWIGERIKAKERRVGLTDSAPLPLLAMGGE